MEWKSILINIWFFWSYRVILAFTTFILHTFFDQDSGVSSLLSPSLSAWSPPPVFTSWSCNSLGKGPKNPFLCFALDIQNAATKSVRKSGVLVCAHGDCEPAQCHGYGLHVPCGRLVLKKSGCKLELVVRGVSERRSKRSRCLAGSGNGNVAGPHPENFLLGFCASLGIAVLLLHQPELHEAEHLMEKEEAFCRWLDAFVPGSDSSSSWLPSWALLFSAPSSFSWLKSVPSQGIAWFWGSTMRQHKCPPWLEPWACATGSSVYPRVLRNLEERYSGFCGAAARHCTGRMKESIQKRIFFFLMKLFLLMKIVSNGKETLLFSIEI